MGNALPLFTIPVTTSSNVPSPPLQTIISYLFSLSLTTFRASPLSWVMCTVTSYPAFINISGFKESKADIEKYLGKKKGYKKNQYKYEDRTVRLVEENWGMALKEWGYSL